MYRIAISLSERVFLCYELPASQAAKPRKKLTSRDNSMAGGRAFHP